jgi:H+/Cl- antiporter ClcA
MMSTARLLGQTTGVAIASVLFSIYPGHSTIVAIAVAAGMAAAAAGFSLLRLHHQRRLSA